MASVPSAGCLLAKNQYYRKSSISSFSSSCGTDTINFTDQEKVHSGLPDISETSWWIKSFFYSEPVLPNIRRKDLTSGSINS
ncbi:pancreatic progenitor cell differentiation and proliferation factor-like protein [Tachyglossus aculeatus]|uniref:pancreatic progenitor cell differentiation and proliferation factor-like protein n=1 Tax=Tachyglossus aculeatus TaxID=9261 RepID=UPI0018F75606|nr:pancreatic progenitor cell differentiation and proliferation factor-like protein [Tachyglossus aculeatus]